MVDSIKQYNLAGVASELELGKRGAKIDGSRSADQVSLRGNDGNLINAEIANATLVQHAVTKQQLDEAAAEKLQDTVITVNYDDTTVDFGTFAAGSNIFSVTVTKGAGNWLGATGNTEITVGTASNNSLLFSGFDPAVQCVDEINTAFSSDTAVKAFVTTGGASAGTATIRILYAGVFTAA